MEKSASDDLSSKLTTKMEKHMPPKIAVPEALSMDTFKTKCSMISPDSCYSQTDSPKTHNWTKPATSTTPTPTGKWNCLCSPTTHVGSFRCRMHRAGGLGGMVRGGSVGSNLSELASKSRPLAELI
ncbi:hypothetical protein LINGRAPRIM_LOCUS1269 [Linum grandiflorum]